MTQIELDEKQNEALGKVQAFLENPDQQLFRLFGAAGVGKSTLIYTLTQMLDKYILAALSGKAVDVLRNKGMPDAQTLHSFLYKPILGDPDLIDELVDQLNKTTDSRKQTELRAQLANLVEIGWTLSNRAQEVQENPSEWVVILDEASMVGKSLFEDLLALGVKVIAVGDPFQLPPVKDKPFLTADHPDVLLTEPHRAALESGVYRLATEIRQGNMPKQRREEDCIVTSNPQVANGELMSNFTQVIVGMHKNRRWLNRILREYRGFKGALPQPGERLICVKNMDVPINGEETLRVYNGQELEVVERPDPTQSKKVPMTLVRAKDPDTRFYTNVYDGHFADHYDYDQDRAYWDHRIKKDLFECDFGHAITAHKAQGSEYDSCFVYHDGFGKSAEEKQAWLYTAVTRPKGGVVLYSPFAQ